MPVHDWSRVIAGTFHHFHLGWISEISNALNGGLLPADYDAMAEQIVGPFGPDTAAAEMDDYVQKQRTLVIRHGSDDRIAALVEVVSPGNKASRHALRSFVERATEALYRGYHLLILDVQPPTPRGPQGIHGAIWGQLSDDPYEAPAGLPLTLAAYSAGRVKRAFIEPTAVGAALAEMPLFLEPEAYVNVPLEQTYRAASRGVPARWKRVVEAEA